MPGQWPAHGRRSSASRDGPIAARHARPGGPAARAARSESNPLAVAPPKPSAGPRPPTRPPPSGWPTVGSRRRQANTGRTRARATAAAKNPPAPEPPWRPANTRRRSRRHARAGCRPLQTRSPVERSGAAPRRRPPRSASQEPGATILVRCPAAPRSTRPQVSPSRAAPPRTARISAAGCRSTSVPVRVGHCRGAPGPGAANRAAFR